MQTLLVRSNPIRHRRATDSPPNHPGFTHYTTFAQPARRVSYDGLFKPNVSCKFVADHGKFTSTISEFSTRSFLFNQSVSHQKTWQLHSTRRARPAGGAVKGLILANVAVFLLWRVADEKFMTQNFTVQWDNLNSGRYHTMITSAFSHVGVVQIVSNMIGLYFRGKSIERRYGSEFLLKLYLVGAFAGSVSFLVHRAFLTPASKENKLPKPDPSEAAAHGASGALNAILILDTLLSPMDIFTLLTLIYRTWEDIQRVKEDGRISGSIHLGGAAVGIIAWAWLRKGRS